MNQPASSTVLADLQHSMGLTLPADYAAFMLAHDGGHGSIGEWPVNLLSLEEVAPLSEAYRVREFAPGFVVFATTGIGVGYAFDTRRQPWIVVSVDWGNIDSREGEHWPMATSFTAFLKAMEAGWEVGDPMVTDD